MFLEADQVESCSQSLTTVGIISGDDIHLYTFIFMIYRFYRFF